MLSYKTNFTKRYFLEDQSNGLLGVGFIQLTDLPMNVFVPKQPFYSCFLVLSGCIDIYDANGSTCCLTPGDIYQVLPGEDAPFISGASPEDIIFHVILGEHTYNALSSCGLLSKDSFFHITIESFLWNWMDVLSEQIKNTPQTELAEVYLNIQKLLINIHKPVVSKEIFSTAMLIESAKQLLSDACLTDISFSDISTSLGLSYENFRKIFKKETGQSPLQYTLEQKFLYAQRFLTEGKSVKETAIAVGYADPYIFSKQFKKYVGVSPSHFQTSKYNPLKS